MPKRFENPYAGVIKQSRNRRTGTLVSVVDNRDGIHSDDGPWMAVCESHGSILITDTRAMAIWQSAAPDGFCEDCQSIADRKGI